MAGGKVRSQFNLHRLRGRQKFEGTSDWFDAHLVGQKILIRFRIDAKNHQIILGALGGHDEVLEAWAGTVKGTKIYEIKSKGDFIKLVSRTHWKMIRAFLTRNDRLFGWDAYDLVHPDAMDLDLGDRRLWGLPLHLRTDRIIIRHHGRDDEVVYRMLREVEASQMLHRIYGGKLPQIWGEDNDSMDERLDNKDWSEFARSDIDWTDYWSSY